MQPAVNEVIVIEGIDGSGKTTLINNLADEFRKSGVEPLETHSPIMPYMRELIRSNLKKDFPTKSDKEIIATEFFIDKFMALQVGGWIYDSAHDRPDNPLILDRFIHSWVVYNSEDIEEKKAAKMFEKCLFELFQRVCDETFRTIIYVYIDLSADEAMKRINARGETKECFEKEEEIVKAEKKFKKIFGFPSHMMEHEEYAKNHIAWYALYNTTDEEEDSYCIHVDGTLEPEEMAKKVFDAIQKICP